MMKALLLGGALLALSAGSAFATIEIDATPSFVQPDENVLFNGGTSGNLAFGSTNQTQTDVVFTGNENLVEPAMGQARLEAADGGLTVLDIALADPLVGFTEFEFNLMSSEDGTVTLSFFDQFGNEFGGDFALSGNGQNFFGARALDNQLITRVSFSSTVDLDDVRQVRLGPFENISAIPEPATWAMMIVGFGAAGTMIRSARRRQQLAI